MMRGRNIFNNKNKNILITVTTNLVQAPVTSTTITTATALPHHTTSTAVSLIAKRLNNNTQTSKQQYHQNQNNYNYYFAIATNQKFFYSTTNSTELTSSSVQKHENDKDNNDNEYWRQVTMELLSFHDTSFMNQNQIQEYKTLVLGAIEHWINEGIHGVDHSMQLLQCLSLFCDGNDDTGKVIVDAVLQHWIDALLTIQHSNENYNDTDNHTISLILSTWTPSRVLEQIQSIPFTIFQPDPTTYLVLLQAATEQHLFSPHQGILFADQLLHDVLNDTSAQPATLISIVHFTTIMNGWIQSQRRETIEMIDKWYTLAQQLHKQGWPQVQPDIHAFNIRLQAFCNFRQFDKAQNLLFDSLQQQQQQQPEQYDNDKNYVVLPNSQSFHIILEAWSKSHRGDAIHAATNLVSMMQTLHMNHFEDTIKVTSTTYMYLMKCFLHVGKISEAEKILFQLHELYDATKDDTLRPSVDLYNMVLFAWVGEYKSFRAQSLLQKMIAKKMPNKRSFDLVLSAFAKRGQSHEAMDILQQMRKYNKDNHRQDIPHDIKSYNIVLQSLGRSKSKSAWKRAKQLLQDASNHGLVPTTETYNAYLDTLVHLGDINMVERFVQEYQDWFRQDDDDDNDNNNTSSSPSQSGPNIETWNTVLAAHARYGSPERAHEIYTTQLLVQQEQEKGSHYCIPNSKTHCLLLQCYTKDKNDTKWMNQAQEHAENLLEQIIKINSLHHQQQQQHHNTTLDTKISFTPDRFLYRKLLNFFIHINDIDKAERILLEMCRDFIMQSSSKRNNNGKKNKKNKNPIPSPHRDLFHLILRKWQESNEMERISLLISQMIELHGQRGLDLKPTTETYQYMSNKN